MYKIKYVVLNQVIFRIMTPSFSLTFQFCVSLEKLHVDSRCIHFDNFPKWFLVSCHFRFVDCELPLSDSDLRCRSSAEFQNLDSPSSLPFLERPFSDTYLIQLVLRLLRHHNDKLRNQIIRTMEGKSELND